MSLDKLFILLFCSFGIIFTYWYFLKKDEKEVSVSDSVVITVSGGYNPEIISVPVGKETILHFKRIDENSCLEEVVLSDFKIKKYLPLNQIVTIEIKPGKKGEFQYSCGMNMFHGKIIVK